MLSPRAENLSPSTIAGIVRILAEWQGDISWKALIDVVERRYRSRYTRQALHKHRDIYDAYVRQKEGTQGLSGNSSRTRLDAQQLEQRLSRLEADIARLTAENGRLMEQQVRFIYNAHIRGIDKALLSQELPRVSRTPTKHGLVRSILKSVPK